MKRIISLLLAIVCFATLATVPAFAVDNKFDKSALKASSYYSEDSFSGEWKFVGGYEKGYTNAGIFVYALLFDDYVEDGLGPELRIIYHDKETDNYDKVTSFKASVDGVVYCFDNLGEGEMGGYVFGGSVYRKFMDALQGASEVAFQFVHEDVYGDVYTSTENHVHTGEVANLAKAGAYLNKAKAWTADSDPDYKDELFNAYILGA